MHTAPGDWSLLLKNGEIMRSDCLMRSHRGILLFITDKLVFSVIQSNLHVKRCIKWESIVIWYVL